MSRQSFTIQTHVDVRLVADVLKAFRASPATHQPLNNSELVRGCLTAFRDSALKETERFVNTSEALSYLEGEGFSTIQAGRKRTKLTRHIILDDRSIDDLTQHLTQPSTELKKKMAEIEEALKEEKGDKNGL